MKLKLKPKPFAEPDLTSFADIAMLMIIFFILTTTFIKPFGHQIEIPTGTSDPARKDDNQLTVSMKGDQIIYGSKARRMDIQELRMQLAGEQLRKRPPSKRMVVVECAKDVPYQRYFEVVMAITESGGVLALLEEGEETK